MDFSKGSLGVLVQGTLLRTLVDVCSESLDGSVRERLFMIIYKKIVYQRFTGRGQF